MSARRMAMLASLGLCAMLLIACAAQPTPSPAVTGLPAHGGFDYQLGGAYPPDPDVSLVVRDRTARPSDGAYSICYINAFQTQPAEQDHWPHDTLLTSDAGPVIDPDWPDEILLDTSSAPKRAAITHLLTAWIEGCAHAGFDGVEFDNLDSFTRSDGALTVDDNLALAARIARIAHDAGLAVGQKNAAEFSPRLRDEADFDFAVAEECAAYGECDAYTKVYGDAVVDIEYTDQLPESFAALCAEEASPRAMILRDRHLVTPDQNGYVYEACQR
ncbi:hypothetical protein CW368_04685 [Actinomycetales bacterium SN12]|nr:hypothetical protein CW368_04685 [Actinomycetales bacterium SN12]